jgi:hypothetical protein
VCHLVAYWVSPFLTVVFLIIANRNDGKKKCRQVGMKQEIDAIIDSLWNIDKDIRHLALHSLYASYVSIYKLVLYPKLYKDK